MPNETDNEEGARGNISRCNFFERIGVPGAVAAMPTGPVPAAAQPDMRTPAWPGRRSFRKFAASLRLLRDPG
jgi:hypothetical protein